MRGEGIAPEAIDAALVAFGMPMGPTELADAGVIFGTGFAPYTGGPMSYLANKARTGILTDAGLPANPLARQGVSHRGVPAGESRVPAPGR